MPTFNQDESFYPQQVRIVWTRETPTDEHAQQEFGMDPTNMDEGFFPSRDPEAAGYVNPDQFDEMVEAAEQRLADWKAGDWEYIGIVAAAEVHIPIGGNSFVVHTFRSAGLWGVESDSDESYIADLYAEQKADLLDSLKTLGTALSAGNFAQEER